MEKRHCANCDKKATPEKPLEICTCCRMAWYCDAVCQGKNRKSHKKALLTKKDQSVRFVDICGTVLHLPMLVRQLGFARQRGRKEMKDLIPVVCIHPTLTQWLVRLAPVDAFSKIAVERYDVRISTKDTIACFVERRPWSAMVECSCVVLDFAVEISEEFLRTPKGRSVGNLIAACDDLVGRLLGLNSPDSGIFFRFDPANKVSDDPIIVNRDQANALLIPPEVLQRVEEAAQEGFTATSTEITEKVTELIK